MNHRKPPALATWMLDHLRSRRSNEALSGDLLEAFRTGRSAGWYWYQVIVAIAIAWGRNVWHHRVTLSFAAIWSTLSPAWELLAKRFDVTSLIGYTSRLPFPWSTVCEVAFFLVAALLFIWLGVAVYPGFQLLAFDRLPLRSVRKGFLWGLLAYASAGVFLIAIAVYFPQPAGHTVNWRNLTMLDMLEHLGMLNLLGRFQYFIATATTLWFLDSRDNSEQVRAA
jgi:hypothetical protein